MNHRTRAASAFLMAALVAIVLTGCTPIVAMTSAANADSRACASVVVGLPAALGTAAKRETDAQGTGAWGDPVSVRLYCGVTPPGPTTAACFSDPQSGVDWLYQTITANGSKTITEYVATTFGRSPAVQVVFDSRVLNSSDVIPPISSAVKAAIPQQTGRCTAAPSS